MRTAFPATASSFRRGPDCEDRVDCKKEHRVSAFRDGAGHLKSVSFIENANIIDTSTALTERVSNSAEHNALWRARPDPNRSLRARENSSILSGRRQLRRRSCPKESVILRGTL